MTNGLYHSHACLLGEVQEVCVHPQNFQTKGVVLSSVQALLLLLVSVMSCDRRLPLKRCCVVMFRGSEKYNPVLGFD